MKRQPDTPTGLVGAEPSGRVFAWVTLGLRGKSGAPILKDRFWIMNPTAAGRQFGHHYALARDPHPSYQRWNELGRSVETLKKKGQLEEAEAARSRVAMMRGNLVHAELADSALWNRSAMKLPDPHPNPKSMRPCCEGNGIRARRFVGVEEGVEVFKEMACPNRLCEFAMAGLCKPSATLVFMPRWRKDDPFEADFPAAVVGWSTRGWHSLENLLGLYELILGTGAVCPWKPEKEWKRGLAQELGVDRPSLFGLPFVMSVSEKTVPGKQQRFPVVSFSPDGDLGAWLLAQKQQREALAAGSPLAALPPAPASVRDPELQPIVDQARAEFDPAMVEPIEPETTAPTLPLHQEALLAPEKAAKLLRMAEAANVSPEALEDEAVRLAGSPILTRVPARFETDLMGFIERKRGRRP